jgi:hypothetical protein
VIPLNWQKSSYSSEASNCVELASTPGGAVHLRESDDPARMLCITRTELAALLNVIAHEPA